VRLLVGFTFYKLINAYNMENIRKKGHRIKFAFRNKVYFGAGIICRKS
jgi:hypothetical protein